MTKHDWHWVAGWALLAAAPLVGCARQQQPAERVDLSSAEVLRTAFAVKSTAGPKAAIPDPDGWATLKGTFKFVGTPPARKPQNVTRDHSVCAPGGKPPLGDELMVDSGTSGIRDVAIYLIGPHEDAYPIGDPKWEHESYAKARTEELIFDQKQCIFLTHMLAVRSSQTVRVKNSDTVGHNTNFNAIGVKSENFTVPENGYAIYTPGKADKKRPEIVRGQSPRPFKINCGIHPWMGAMMLVRESPYFAVTKANGSFEILNVPSGVELEFQVFQETAKPQWEVTVKAESGQDPKWDQDKFKIKLTKDTTETLNIEVKATTFNQ